MPSMPRKSSFTPAQIRIEDLDLVPVRVARTSKGGYSLVTSATVALGTADGRRFGTRTATVRIPVEPAGAGGGSNGAGKGKRPRRRR